MRHAAFAAYPVLAAAYLTISLTRPGGLLLAAVLGVGGSGLGVEFAAQPGRLTSAVPDVFATEVSGMVTMMGQLAGVVGVAVFGAVHPSLAAHPGHALTVVMAALSGTALAAALAAYAGGRARGWVASQAKATAPEPAAAEH